MKRNTLITVVLCLMMITTSEAGAKSAKHDENPRQAGKSSIYFYDVESKEGSGYGRLVINADKKTFTFIGQDFLPSQHVYIKVDTEGQFQLIADGKSTKSGNLHIQGEWEGVPPKPESVGAYYIWGPAYGFTLDNVSGYVAHIKVQWSTDNGVTWHTTSNQSKDVSLWEISVVSG